MTTNLSFHGPRVSDATPPFDKHNADIILRSSDLVDFRVYSQILIASSPFFEGLFQVPQPPAEEQPRKYGLPIVEVSEDSKTLDYLLRLCYPIKKPHMFGVGGLQVLESALRAAMKYEMELADTLLTTDLVNLAGSYPLEVWAIGCRLGLENMASRAGSGAYWRYRELKHRSAHLPDLDLPSSVSILEGVTAGQLFRLYRYIGTFHFADRTLANYQFISPSPTISDVAPSEKDSSESSNLLPAALTDMASADIVCRSSDGTTFHAHQAVLGAASAVLRAKIARVTTDAGDESSQSDLRERSAPLGRSLPVLQFEETSTVLPHLLSCCYPGLIPIHLANLSQLIAVIAATARHDIAVARPDLLDQWSRMASADPLRAYVLSTQVGDTACAKEAAKHVLNGPLVGVYVHEMESSPALAYQRLLSYYRSCKNRARRGLVGVASTQPAAAPPQFTSGQEEEPVGATRSQRACGGIMDPDLYEECLEDFVPPPQSHSLSYFGATAHGVYVWLG